MEKIQIEKVLERLGFSPNEIKTYLVLNDHGSCKAGKVAKLAKIDRSSCYNSIKSLQEKGLISYVIIANVKWFQATGPKRLLHYLKEQQREVEEILPELHARHKRSKVEGQVRLFKGLKGVRTILQDIVRAGKDNVVFGSESQLEERMPAYHKQFVRQLNEKKMKVKEIVREDRKSKTNDPNLTRYVSKSIKSPVVTNIYDDKIALIIWTDEPEGVIIENKAAADAYRSYFKFMWNNAKKK
jgi:HTH-type transcriptional regulator, sugar sensing transcriptional regulator